MPRNGKVARRVASPRKSSVENVSSLKVAIRAMSVGSNNGTLYSSRNSSSVISHDRYFSSPALKKTDPTAIRISSCSTDSGTRESQPRSESNIFTARAVF
jgi:hypothetical protein